MVLSNRACELPYIPDKVFPPLNDWSTHKLLAVVGGVSTALTLAISLVNIYRHLANYSDPTEQRHIVRILLTPFVFGLFNAIALCFYETAEYLEPVAGLYEVFAVVAIFLLFLAYIVPDPSGYETSFGMLERRFIVRQHKKHEHGSLRWFHVIWVLVFQILPLHLVSAIAGWILKAVTCPTDLTRRYAGIAIQAVQSVSTITALLAIVCFYRRLQSPLKARSSLSKFTTFKIIISIALTQGPVFAGLNQGGVLKSTEYISFEDWAIGVPALCICCEMLVFSILFSWPFSASEYSLRDLEAEKVDRRPLARLSFWFALLDAVNISDVIRGAFLHSKNVKIVRRKVASGKTLDTDGLPVLKSASSLTTSDSVRGSASVDVQWTIVDLRKIDAS
ncbi:hypothetical protein LTR53_009202 [Teratosphaeriaceae sp. CCFEE 6253]|nr:hypothetical protein LTR53_009202 [Teratosphaeriaceae sp. CCFEE 6253]